MITSYDLVRSVLSDSRFSSQKQLLRSPILKEEPAPAKPGFFLYTDPPDHTKYRQLLTGQFTVRRMNQLAERVREIADELLDHMEEAGPPSDLVESFALPLPSLIICELLGIPYEEREVFQQNTAKILDTNTPRDEALKALETVQVYLQGLIARRRIEPTDDLLSGLAAHDELTSEEVTNISFLLLAAGHDTTANMISTGTFALLVNPDQLEHLRSNLGKIGEAVEELMRYVTINHYGPVRAALEDVKIGGQQILAGDVIVLSAAAANRDSNRFHNPDRLDFIRGGRGQISFGHGIHQCVGQQLARIEMRVGFDALLRRFPKLRLAVPQAEVPMRDSMLIYGALALPVSW